jgi:asparagine synthetase B (glutamine-hydrolysing)
MFLFVSTADRSRLSEWSDLHPTGGPLSRYEHGRSVLFWSDDGFTRFESSATGCICEMRRPGVDEDAICRFKWNCDQEVIEVERSWSGEFRVYFASRPDWMVSSHLWAIGAACRGIMSSTKKLRPGWCLKIDRTGAGNLQSLGPCATFRVPVDDYPGKVKLVRHLVWESVRRANGPAALLLSGGLDSSIIAAVAAKQGRKIHPFVFGLRRAVRPRPGWENDFHHADRVAEHLGLTCEKIFIDPETLRANVPLAVALAETPRGTIIDDCVALIEVAKCLYSRGFSTVWTGDGADDLFGGFKFVLNYYRGRELKEYFRRSLDLALPDEMAIIQRVFEPWRISVIHPFWTAELKAIGRSLPLRHRLDRRRLMKRILRDAFSDTLPEEICRRPKGATRDTTQVRWVLEQEYGCSRERYRPLFHEIFRSEFQWPRNGKEQVTKKLPH